MALVEEHAEDLAALRDLCRFVDRIESRRRFADEAEGAEEPDHVIDAEQVVELSHAPRARPEPSPAAAPHRLPAVHRQAPALAGGAEVVGRSTHRPRGIEQAGIGPDVGAVLRGSERQVAHQRHVVLGGRPTHLSPRLLGRELQELEERDSLGQPGSGIGERAWIAPA